MTRRNKSTILIDKAHSLSVTLKKVIWRERLCLTNAKARTSNPKCFWRLVNSFIGSRKDSSIKVKSGEQVLTDAEAIES